MPSPVSVQLSRGNPCQALYSGQIPDYPSGVFCPLFPVSSSSILLTFPRYRAPSSYVLSVVRSMSLFILSFAQMTPASHVLGCFMDFIPLPRCHPFQYLSYMYPMTKTPVRISSSFLCSEFHFIFFLRPSSV